MKKVLENLAVYTLVAIALLFIIPFCWFVNGILYNIPIIRWLIMHI